jgi:nicotinic acid mononucleotide adenylyltransferase
MEQTPEATPLEVFHQLYEPQRKKQCVLLSTGSMNPVHKGHVSMLEAAQQCLEAKGWTVVGGWLSPSDASWSSGKPFGALSNEAKLSLCRLALQSSALFRVSSWEVTQPNVVDYPAVLRHVKSLVPVPVFYVCGSDHALKCGLHHNPAVVIVSRSQHLPPSPCTAHWTSSSKELEDVSSTKIRKALQEEGSVQRVRGMLHPAVADELDKMGTIK